MSDEEFLKRWSRRKQAAKAAEVPPQPVPAETNIAAADSSASDEFASAASASDALAAPEPEIDLSKLPSLDSITAGTDITEFLRKGIPAELSRAALRRAWSADPGIRDFVGLAENAWDFTDPNAIPGFGALHATPEQIGAMVERVMGTVRDVAEKVTSQLPENDRSPQKAEQEPSISSAGDTPPLVEISATPLPHTPTEPVAAVQLPASHEDDDDVALRRRTHGGALPS